MNYSYFKLLLLFVFLCFVACKEQTKKQISDFDAFFLNFPKTDYVQIQRINLNSDKNQDYYIWEKTQNSSTIIFFDGKTKNKIEQDSIKGKVSNNFISVINTGVKYLAHTYTVSEKEKEIIKIIQYNPTTKRMETIFEYAFILKKGKEISEINYIDIFDNLDNNQQKITIYKGKLVDEDYTNIESIKQESKTILKTFTYNTTTEKFEEEKTAK